MSERDRCSDKSTDMPSDGALRAVAGYRLLRKIGDHFESMDSMPASFVPVEGKCKISALEPSELGMLPEWAELQKKEVIRTPFWWGGKGEEAGGSRWRTTGIRSFLSIAEPSFRVFKRARWKGVPVMNTTSGYGIKRTAPSCW